ncbi:hypothetical protein NC652_037963 [Populus alba x Populus x berolinensis]|nr:hypothetical protein NC652_037963 [Populus alba x Populus x berolinensis]
MGLFLRWSLRDHRVSKLLYLFSWHNFQGSFESILLLSEPLSFHHPMMTLLFLFWLRGSLAGDHVFDSFMLAPDWAILMGAFCKQFSTHVASSQTLFGGLAALCSDFLARMAVDLNLLPWEGGDPFFSALLSGEYRMEHILSSQLGWTGLMCGWFTILTGRVRLSPHCFRLFGCCNFRFTGRPLEIAVKDLFLPGLCPFCLHMRLILMMFCLLRLWSNATLLSLTFASAQPCCSGLERGGFCKLSLELIRVRFSPQRYDPLACYVGMDWYCCAAGSCWRFCSIQAVWHATTALVQVPVKL